MLGLPLLSAMMPAMSRAQTPALLFDVSASSTVPMVLRETSKGSTTGHPKAKVRTSNCPRSLRPRSLARPMLIVSGLAQHQADAFDDGANGDHTRGTSSWLTGVHPKRTEGADVRNGISADQIAAAQLGKNTALPSLELAIDLNFLGGQCREQLQLLLPQYPGLEQRHDASADGEQSAHRIRTVVRRRRNVRAAAPTGPCQPNDLSIRSWKTSIVFSRRWARPTARSSATTSMRFRKWSGEFKASKPRERNRNSDTRATGGNSRKSSMNTSSSCTNCSGFVRCDARRHFMLGRELNFRTYPEIGITKDITGFPIHGDSTAHRRLGQGYRTPIRPRLPGPRKASGDARR